MVQPLGDVQTLVSPAKINLTLRVLDRRSDGYHDLESVVVLVSLFDRIDVQRGDGPAIKISCTHPAVPIDSHNTVWQAIQILHARFMQSEPLFLQIHKRISPGGGLGGGSSNAAAVLRYLNQRWHLGLHQADLLRLGAGIGSDVPLFLSGPAVWMQGRGERVESVKCPWNGWIVLAIPLFGVDTKKVYEQWDQIRTRRESDCDSQLCLNRSCTTSDQLNEVLFNDLEESAFRIEPRLRDFREFLERSSGNRFFVSGSGSVCFACVDDPQRAEHLRLKLEECKGLTCEVVRILEPSLASNE